MTFDIKPKHWWQWLNPRFLMERRKVMRLVNYYQKEMDRLIQQRIDNDLLFGPRIVIPKDFYGTPPLDVDSKDDEKK